MGHRFSILIAIIATVSWACASPHADPPRSPELIPAVALATLAGDHTPVIRVAEGRVALISLWATWCEACDREMDALNRLAMTAAAGRDAVVIGVDVGEDPERVGEFARRRGLRYTQLIDEDFAFADALGQRRVPGTLVVDRTGRIVFQGDALDKRSLDALRRAIAEAP